MVSHIVEIGGAEHIDAATVDRQLAGVGGAACTSEEARVGRDQIGERETVGLTDGDGQVEVDFTKDC